MKHKMSQEIDSKGRASIDDVPNSELSLLEMQ